MIRIVDKRQCCGCAACVQKCPKHCISFYEDEEGFLYPRIDTNNCIDCGLCEKVCPFLNCDKAVPPQEVWAVKIKMNRIEFTVLREACLLHWLVKYWHGAVWCLVLSLTKIMR